MKTIRFDQASFLEELSQTIQWRRLTWRQAAHELGVQASSLTRMRQGHNPSMELFARAIHWMGKKQMKLVSFVR